MAREARRWSAEEDQRLLHAIAAGHLPAAAGAAAGLNRTPAACQMRATHLRRTGHDVPNGSRTITWSDEETKRLISAYGAGATLEELAEQLGCTVSAVDDYICRLRDRGTDLPERKPRWTDARRHRLAKRKAEGASLAQLEREFGLTRGSITSQLRTLRRIGLVPPHDAE